MSRPPPSDAVPSRILVVDDHRKIREPLAVLLRREGFDVRVAEGAAAMALVLRHTPVDLVVLDAMLPDGDGFALCRQLREAGGPPVILLTARAEAHDRIAGLEQGADDYVVKPFEPAELVARIRSVLRRTQAVPARPDVAPVAAAARHAFGPWTLDAHRAVVTHAEGREVELSATELRLLGLLLQHAQTVVSRAQLQASSGRPAPPGFERTIDRQISRLRQKIEPDPRQPTLLRTAWGDGYLLTVACVPLAP